MNPKTGGCTVFSSAPLKKPLPTACASLAFQSSLRLRPSPPALPFLLLQSSDCSALEAPSLLLYSRLQSIQWPHGTMWSHVFAVTCLSSAPVVPRTYWQMQGTILCQLLLGVEAWGVRVPRVLNPLWPGLGLPPSPREGISHPGHSTRLAQPGERSLQGAGPWLILVSPTREAIF